MNDLQFKKQLQSAPFQLNKEMLAYLEAHPELKKTVKRAQQFDQQIEQALDIDVPEGLAARILLKQSHERHFNEKKANEKNPPFVPLTQTQTKSRDIFLTKASFMSWKSWGSLAASVMIVFIGLGAWQERTVLFPLKATDVIAHVLHHVEKNPKFMNGEKIPKTEQDLHALFLAVGASIEHPIEHMSYAGECVINGQIGLHIVLQEADGPVTIIIMPGQQLIAMEAFEASGYQGELLPVKGGVVAIMGKGRKQVALAHMRFFKAVKFV